METGDLPEKVIVIGGLPRSGKTLLRNLLGSNSELAIPPSAFNFFCYFNDGDFAERGTYDENAKFFFDSAWKSGAFGLTEEMLVGTGETPRDLYVNILESYRQAHFPAKRYVGEYTHLEEEYFDKFVEWFGLERIKFIQVIRNPYDNYASYIENRAVPAKERHTRDHRAFVHRFCHMWSQSTVMALYRSNRYPDACRTLFLEPFKRDQEALLADLCRWLGIEYEPERMLGMVDYGGVGTRSSSSSQDRGADAATREKADRISLLTDYEKEAIGLVCCPNLAHIMEYEELPIRVNWKFGPDVPPEALSAAFPMMLRSSASLLGLQKAAGVYLRTAACLAGDVGLGILRRLTRR